VSPFVQKYRCAVPAAVPSEPPCIGRKQDLDAICQLAAKMHPVLRRQMGSENLSAYLGSPEKRSRLLQDGLPLLSQCRLVDGRGAGAQLRQDCEALYLRTFGADEAEDPKVTHQRRVDMDILYGATATSADASARTILEGRYGSSRFYHVAALDHHGRVVGQSQFSILPVQDSYVAAYCQYVSVASASDAKALYGYDNLNFRGRGIFVLLRAIELALAAGHGARIGHPNLLGFFSRAR
jgi:hypothetical protein